MLGSGFFTTLFNQFVAVLSSFCVNLAPGGSVPYLNSPDTGSPTVAVSRQVPYPTRVLETQFNAGVEIGRVIARSADGVTAVVLALPEDLVNALDRGGITALPSGFADSGRRVVRLATNTTTNAIEVLTDVLLSELNLLPGADEIATKVAFAAQADPADGSDVSLALQRQPLIVRIVTTQFNAVSSVSSALSESVGGVLNAILRAPQTISEAAAKGGSLAAGLQLATRQVVLAASDGAVRLVRSVGEVLQSELDLIPGGGIAGDPRTAAKVAVEPAPRNPGAGRLLELPIRVPLAFAVAGSDLVQAGLRAVTQVTGGFAQAISDVVQAAVNQFGGGGKLPDERATISAAKESLTVAEALRRAPVTIGNGFTEAGETLRLGVQDARRDFRRTLNPRLEEQQRVAASGGLNTTVNGTQATLASATPANGSAASSSGAATDKKDTGATTPGGSVTDDKNLAGVGAAASGSGTGDGSGAGTQ
jgi:hypothetical protein